MLFLFVSVAINFGRERCLDATVRVGCNRPKHYTGHDSVFLPRAVFVV